MNKDLISKKVQNLQTKAISLGTDLEMDHPSIPAEMLLNDFISEVVDDTNEILNNIEERI